MIYTAKRTVTGQCSLETLDPLSRKLSDVPQGLMPGPILFLRRVSLQFTSIAQFAGFHRQRIDDILPWVSFSALRCRDSRFPLVFGGTRNNGMKMVEAYILVRQDHVFDVC
jgi:hypothetical protein